MTTLTGTNTADVLRGGNHSELLIGRGGNDKLIGGVADDTCEGGNGNDFMAGGRDNDFLIGGRGDDFMTGGHGNDQLDGGGGNDDMMGGIGDDTYIVNSRGDSTTEFAAKGTDTVIASIDWSLDSNVENLTLTGSAAAGVGNVSSNVLTGNAGDNTLDGRAGDDTINGGDGEDILAGRAGNDVLDGGAGSDALLGGAGDDTLVWDAADDIINGGAGTDTLRTNGSLDLTAIDHCAIRNIEVVDLTGSGNNTLRLAASEVVAISATTDTLRVDGNTGDVVTSSEDWVQGATSDGYTTYTNGAATLQVQAGVVFDDNEAAVITGATTGAVFEDGTEIATGDLDVTDADAGEATFQATGAATTYGAYTVNAAGAWSYDLANDNATVQALAGSATLADSFTVLSADGTGRVVSITITGDNDAAVITGATTGAVFEDGTEVATGDLDVTDGDAGEATFQATGAATTYGAYTVNAAGAWSYDLANDNATVQALAEGATLADSFTVLSADGTAQVVSITITGDNDGPGTSGPDLIIGTNAADTISSLAGADTVTGHLGGDTLDVGTDSDADRVIYTTVNDGAAPGVNTNFDIIAGFVQPNDFISFDGAAEIAIDDGTIAGTVTFVTNTAANFTDGSGVDALLLTSVFTGLTDADLVQSGFTNVLLEINTGTGVGVTASDTWDGLIVVQGSTDTGVYYYLEGDGTANFVGAGELTLLGVIDNALLIETNFIVV